MSVESLPPELVAVTVYVMAVEDTTDGVPLITPVEVLNSRPVGSAGRIAKDTTGPPLVLGRLASMVVSLVYTASAIKKARSVGIAGREQSGRTQTV